MEKRTNRVFRSKQKRKTSVVVFPCPDWPSNIPTAGPTAESGFVASSWEWRRIYLSIISTQAKKSLELGRKKIILHSFRKKYKERERERQCNRFCFTIFFLFQVLNSSQNQKNFFLIFLVFGFFFFF